MTPALLNLAVSLGMSAATVALWADILVIIFP